MFIQMQFFTQVDGNNEHNQEYYVHSNDYFFTAILVPPSSRLSFGSGTFQKKPDKFI